MPSSTFDVIVVGGGIGGLACARALAARGEDVFVVATELPGAADSIPARTKRPWRSSMTSRSASFRLWRRVRAWSSGTGFDRLSPDGLPFIGRAPGAHRLVFATGHSKNGSLLGPWTGEMVADLIETASDCSIASFSPARFVGGVA